VPRIIEARGPVVEALKRYDSGLRVRWSFEKQKWAIEARVMNGRRDKLLPPVTWERVAETDQWREKIMPELSERYISFHSGTYVIGWVKEITPSLLRMVRSKDQAQMAGGAKGQLYANLRATRDEREKVVVKRREETTYAGWDYMKFLGHNKPWLADGTGISTKGIGARYD
jgi:hypothetical protein